MAKIDDMIADSDLLTDAEAQRLRAKLTVRLTRAGTSKTAQVEDDAPLPGGQFITALQNSIIQVYKDTTGGNLSPKMLAEMKQWRQVANNFAPDIEKYLIKMTGEESRTRIATEYVLRLGIVKLVEWMRERKIPVSPGAMLSNLRQLPAMYDMQFPGYAQLGFLKFGLMMRGGANGKGSGETAVRDASKHRGTDSV